MIIISGAITGLAMGFLLLKNRRVLCWQRVVRKLLVLIIPVVLLSFVIVIMNDDTRKTDRNDWRQFYPYKDCGEILQFGHDTCCLGQFNISCARN